MITADDLQAFANGVVIQRHATEVDLRRAVSSLYYSLFHSLAAAGSRSYARGGTALVNQVVRAHAHGPMRRVCERYVRSSIRPFQPPLDALNIPPPHGMLIEVADAFVRLQEARHSADYDLSAEFGVDETNELALVLGRALTNLRLVEDQPATLIFLAALLLDDRWSRRG